MLNQNKWISFGPLKYCSFDFRPEYNQWETNYQLGQLSVRIGRHQFAIFWGFNTIVNFIGKNFPTVKVRV